MVDNDLFIGHPVTCDQKDARILVSWVAPGQWFVEAHNPSDQPFTARLQTSPGWTAFDFNESVALPAGSSKFWRVKAK